MNLCSTCRGIPLLDITPVRVGTDANIVQFGKAPIPGETNRDQRFVNFWTSRPNEGETSFAALPGYPYHSSLASLESSALTCPLCRAIWHEAHDLVLVWNDNLPSNVKGVALPPHASLKIVGRMDNGSGFAVAAEAPDYPAYVVVANVCAAVHEKSLFAAQILARPPGPSTLSESSVAWIQSCLQSCEGHQPDCSAPSEVPNLPKRVLDLSSSTNAGTVKLIENEQSTERYAALSYCWGKTKFMTATLENVDRFIAGFPINELPRTMRDAIKTTLALGLRYLWIDALCIMQDSRPDWVEHSASMAQIYGSAYVTIAAQDSYNVDQGFLYDLPFTKDDTILVPLGDAPENVSLFITEAKDWRPSHFNNSALAGRGWCYQERFISSRVLYMCQKDLMFECKTKFLTQQGHVSSSNVPLKAKDSLGKSRAQQITSWSEVVLEYSGRALTKSNDRLPALAGMAKRFQHFTDATYVAGLWSDSILQHLLFSRPGGRTYGTDEGFYDTYIAPSWSWTAYWGAMSIKSVKALAPEGFIAKQVDYHIVLATDNPHGELSSGHLRLRAPLLPLPAKPRFVPPIRTGRIEKFCFGDIVEERRIHLLEAHMIMENYRMTYPEASVDNLPLFVLVLQWTDPACIWNSTEKEQIAGKDLLSALIVTPAVPGKPEMRRVGQVDLFGNDLRTWEKFTNDNTFSEVTLV